MERKETEGTSKLKEKKIPECFCRHRDELRTKMHLQLFVFACELFNKIRDCDNKGIIHNILVQSSSQKQNKTNKANQNKQKKAPNQIKTQKTTKQTTSLFNFVVC